jgi:hypothetical protein
MMVEQANHVRPGSAASRMVGTHRESDGAFGIQNVGKGLRDVSPRT